MNINDSEELLALINRLLEQLHQAGPKNLGVRIQIVLEPKIGGDGSVIIFRPNNLAV